MSRSISQVATLRRLARVYRRMLALAVPAALAACQGAGDSLAPDAAGDPSAPAAAPATAEAVPSSGLLGALVSDRIVFADLMANYGADLWTMGPLGGTLTHLTTFTGRESDPSWSPDHKRIAFTRVRNNYSDIYLMNADGTNKHWARSVTYAGNIDTPSWSPDGTHLLVRVMLQGYPCLGKIDLASGNLTAVAPAGTYVIAGSQPIYDPAGKTIFFVDYHQMVIKRFTPGGALTTLLTSSVYVGDLAISPDGTRLAYYKEVAPGNTEIHVLNLATKVTKRLTFSTTGDWSPSWSPDGTKLAFTSYRSGKPEIWAMSSSTGGSLTRITYRTYGASSPAWTH
jgi:Tol biopolymer transport system component